MFVGAPEDQEGVHRLLDLPPGWDPRSCEGKEWRRDHALGQVQRKADRGELDDGRWRVVLRR